MNDFEIGAREFGLTEGIYDAALNPDHWEQCLKAFAPILGARSAEITFHDVSEPRLTFVRSFQRERAYYDTYAERFITLNPYLEALAGYDEILYCSEDLVPESRLVRSRFYREWLEPQGLHHQLGVVLLRDGTRLAALDFERPKSAGRFSERDRAYLGLFSSHLRRALLINQKFWDLIVRSESVSTVLDSLDIGVILLNEHKRPVYVSKRAEELTRLGVGLIVRESGLSAPWEQQTDELTRLVEEAVLTGRGQGIGAGGSMYLGVFDDRPQQVLVSPMRMVRDDLSEPGTTVCAAVFVASPYNPRSISLEALKSVYKLTDSEAVVVGKLSNGLTLNEVAAELQISRNTVRGHLKSVFQKTGTRRQADLIGLIYRSPGSIISEQELLGYSLGGPLDRRKREDRRTSARITGPQS